MSVDLHFLIIRILLLEVPPQQMQGPPQGAPAPHMNPAFFHPNVPGGPPPGAPYNANGPPGGYPPPLEHVAPPPAITDAEFDEVMSRNRTVSSSAISRAVSDAATGRFRHQQFFIMG